VPWNCTGHPPPSGCGPCPCPGLLAVVTPKFTHATGRLYLIESCFTANRRSGA
jgi:hypothetical protein